MDKKEITRRTNNSTSDSLKKSFCFAFQRFNIHFGIFETNQVTKENKFATKDRLNDTPKVLLILVITTLCTVTLEAIII